MAVRTYTVNIIGLSNSIHRFEFSGGSEFFAQYGTTLISEGAFTAVVSLDKRETMIEATFQIDGTAKLICDRSLDPFDYGITVDKTLVFKYGDSDQELSDEIIMIHRDSDSLELGQYIFEFISLEVPIKKLHPRFLEEEDEDDDSQGRIIYTSKPPSDDDNGEDIDPRWEILKKLK